jgi:hypothetical protein
MMIVMIMMMMQMATIVMMIMMMIVMNGDYNDKIMTGRINDTIEQILGSHSFI